jgi:Flp pilus assembly protein TadD
MIKPKIPIKTIGAEKIALAFAACLALGGCSTLHLSSVLPPKPAVASNDIPDATPIDAKRSQALFLAIVGGLREQGHSSAALAYLDEYDRQYPGDQHAMLLRAQCLVDIDEPAEAEAVFRKLVKGNYAAAAHAGLGQAAAARGDWPIAVGDFGEAARLEPATSQYANDLGFARVKLGDYRGGVAMLDRAAQLAPDNHYIRNNLILGLHLSGKDEQARRLVDTISEPADRAKAQQLLLVQADTVLAPTKQAGPDTGAAKTSDRGIKS